MTRLAIYLRPVRGEPCRRARGRSAYLFVCWPRAAAIARRQHDEFVVRPCDAKHFSILDTHSTRHGTLKPYLSSMLIRDDSNRSVASSSVFLSFLPSAITVGKPHRRYSVFCLSITNQCPWTGEPFRAIAIRSSSVTFPFRFRPLFGIAEQLADIGASYLPRFHSATTFCRTLKQKIRERISRFASISPRSFLSIYRSYLGRPFRVEPRRSLLHTSVVRGARRGFADFLRFGFVERGTHTSRRDASHCSISNSHPTRRRALKS